MVCGVWVCAQMFSSASAFNQNLAGWNILRVTSFASAFDSTTALSSCNKYKLYAAWGTTLRTAYPAYQYGSCVSSFAPLNTPVSGAATVTIVGVGFSGSTSIDPTPSAYLSGQPCTTSSWTSATQLVCAARAPVRTIGTQRLCASARVVASG